MPCSAVSLKSMPSPGGSLHLLSCLTLLDTGDFPRTKKGHPGRDGVFHIRASIWVRKRLLGRVPTPTLAGTAGDGARDPSRNAELRPPRGDVLTRVTGST